MGYYTNRKVLITGAASGLGRLIAERIGRLGGTLILWDRDEEGLGGTRSALEEIGARAHCYVCDLSSREAIQEVARQTLADCGRVDILFNNAGTVSGDSLLRISDEAIVRTFDVNVLALFWTTRAFLPGMVERGWGHIVTTASAGGIAGTANMTDYCASKFAAMGFDESLRAELKRDKLPIRTTVVCPFYISTGMFEGVKTRFAWLLPILGPEDVAERMVDAVARRRQRLVIPRFIYTIYLCRLLPVSVFDWLMDVLGVSKSMDDFTGRRY